MKCPDCNGSGEYKGLDITPEPCQKCKGVGTLDETGQTHTLESIRPKGDSIADSVANNLPEWMGDHEDQLDVTHKITTIKPAEKGGMSTPTNKLQVGDLIYIWDMQRWWDAAAIQDFNGDYAIINGCAVALSKICWNDIQKRWEYIASGTPKWP